MELILIWKRFALWRLPISAYIFSTAWAAFAAEISLLNVKGS
jgi:hypothetical protein